MSETITSSPGARPAVTSKNSTLDSPNVAISRTARSPRTTNTGCVPSPEANGPRRTRSVAGRRAVTISTSTRRFDRSSGFDGCASAMTTVMVPLTTVGSTDAIVPSSVSLPTRIVTGCPALSRLACTSDTLASTRNDV